MFDILVFVTHLAKDSVNLYCDHLYCSFGKQNNNHLVGLQVVVRVKVIFVIL